MHGVGAVVTLTTQVRDSSGDLVNPAAVNVTVQLPDGTTVGPFASPDVATDGAGLFRYDFTTTVAGRHIARWATTTPTGADEEPFDVAALWAEAGMLSLREAKKQLNIDPDDTDDDEEIAGFIRALTEPVERIAGSLVRRPVTETHQGGYMLALNRTPVLSVTSALAIRTGGVDQNIDDLSVDAATGIVQRLDGAWMCGPLTITYVPGRAEMPAHVSLAAKLILQHMWETQRGQMGGARAGGSDEVYDPRFGYSIPRRAQELLGEQLSGIA